MNMIKVGHFEGNGAAVNVNIGFIPSVLLMYIDIAAVNPNLLTWFKKMYDDEATIKYGLLHTGSTGNITGISTAATGISSYDTKSVYPSVNTWTQARGSAATARSATAPGTYIQPTTKPGAIFECVTDGTSAATEPTWNYNIGENTTDGTTVWQAVNVPVTMKGFKGFTAGVDIQDDAKEYYFIAIGADEDVDLGDSAGW